MRINPYERIYDDNLQNKTTNLNNTVNTQTIAQQAQNNNNILSGLLNNQNSLNLIKNFLPLLNNNKNNKQNDSVEQSTINQNLQNNQIQSKKQEDLFPSINPQLSLDTLLNPQPKPSEKKEQSLDNNRQTLIKQMQLHQKMLNKINNNCN